MKLDMYTVPPPIFEEDKYNDQNYQSNSAAKQAHRLLLNS